MFTRAGIAAVSLFASLLAGCGGNVYLLGADASQASATATIIKPAEDTLAFYYKIATVLNVDGESTGYALSEARIHVPPGERTLGVKYHAKDKLFNFRRARAEISFRAEAGRIYRVASKEDLTSVSLWVEDADSGDRVSDIVDAQTEIISDADFSP